MCKSSEITLCRVNSRSKETGLLLSSVHQAVPHGPRVDCGPILGAFSASLAMACCFCHVHRWHLQAESCNVSLTKLTTASHRSLFIGEVLSREFVSPILRPDTSEGEGRRGGGGRESVLPKYFKRQVFVGVKLHKKNLPEIIKNMFFFFVCFCCSGRLGHLQKFPKKHGVVSCRIGSFILVCFQPTIFYFLKLPGVAQLLFRVTHLVSRSSFIFRVRSGTQQEFDAGCGCDTSQPTSCQTGSKVVLCGCVLF